MRSFKLRAIEQFKNQKLPTPRMNLKQCITVALSFCALATSLFARIGSDESQCATLYGLPSRSEKDGNNLINHYSRDGYNVDVTFHAGTAIQVNYLKIVGSQVCQQTEEDIKFFLKSNICGSSWSETTATPES